METTESRSPLKSPETFSLRPEMGMFVRVFVSVFVALLLGAFAGQASGTVALVTSAVSLAVLLVLSVLYGRAHVVLGADGLRIRIGMKSRFVPFADVATVGTSIRGLSNDGAANAVGVTLRSGEYVSLPMIGYEWSRIEGFVSRANEAAARATASRVHMTIGREGRSVEAWREGLRKRVGSSGFRDAGIEVADLERVLASPGAAAEDRIGAALALRAVEVEGAPDRIRIAASQSASTRIRIALEAAADDQLEEAEVEAALSEEAHGAPVADRRIGEASSS